MFGTTRRKVGAGKRHDCSLTGCISIALLAGTVKNHNGGAIYSRKLQQIRTDAEVITLGNREKIECVAFAQDGGTVVHSKNCKYLNKDIVRGTSKGPYTRGWGRYLICYSVGAGQCKLGFISGIFESNRGNKKHIRGANTIQATVIDMQRNERLTCISSTGCELLHKTKTESISNNQLSTKQCTNANGCREALALRSGTLQSSRPSTSYTR